MLVFYMLVIFFYFSTGPRVRMTTGLPRWPATVWSWKGSPTSQTVRWLGWGLPSSGLEETLNSRWWTTSSLSTTLPSPPHWAEYPSGLTHSYTGERSVLLVTINTNLEHEQKNTCTHGLELILPIFVAWEIFYKMNSEAGNRRSVFPMVFTSMASENPVDFLIVFFPH